MNSWEEDRRGQDRRGGGRIRWCRRSKSKRISGPNKDTRLAVPSPHVRGRAAGKLGVACQGLGGGFSFGELLRLVVHVRGVVKGVGWDLLMIWLTVEREKERERAQFTTLAT